MKSRLRVSISLVVLAIPFLTGCEKSSPSVAEASNGADPASHAEKIRRGEYLVKTIGCNDCHTPLKMTDKGPVPDMSRMLSGHPETLKMPRPQQLGEGPWGWVGSSTMTAFYGPWGVSYAFNLTPDNATGPRHLDGRYVHQDDAAWTTHGSVAAGQPADAVAKHWSTD